MCNNNRARTRRYYYVACRNEKYDNIMANEVGKNRR